MPSGPAGVNATSASPTRAPAQRVLSPAAPKPDGACDGGKAVAKADAKGRIAKVLGERALEAVEQTKRAQAAAAAPRGVADAAATTAAAAAAAAAQAHALATASQASPGSGAEEQQPMGTGEPSGCAVRALAVVVPIKNLVSCYLLGPVVLGECRSERFCAPYMNVLLLIADVSVFSMHLFLGIKRKGYRERVPTYNFYILLVFWSVWNLSSHPLCRQHVVDLFVSPPEIHVTVNIAAIAVCSSTVMSPPSMRHLIGLVTCEFLISLVLSGIEVLNFSVDSGWLATMRLDIVMFNVAILLIGSTIILGTMTVEKDIKSLAQEMESRLGPAGAFEDDLERRKRAVLTALCDAVLTTSATFQVIGSDEGADRVFRRPMMGELLTDYFKDQAERGKFLASVKKQFPEDDSVGEGPKRMRVTLRDDSDESFEADVVVSDASTDKNGKVSKYMVGMHIRGEFRARALEDSRQQRTRSGAAGLEKRHATYGEGERDKEKRPDAREPPGEDRANHLQMYEELSHGLLAAFEEVLWPPGGEKLAAEGKGDKDMEEGGPPVSPRQQWRLRRASCEVFRRRAPPLGSRAGDGRHVDLRRLSLPEQAVAGLT